MNGTDEWTGGAKATQVNDQAKDALVNGCKVVEGGKCQLDNAITQQVSGLGTSTLKSTSEFATADNRDDVKTAAQAPSGLAAPPLGLASGTEDAK